MEDEDEVQELEWAEPDTTPRWPKKVNKEACRCRDCGAITLCTEMTKAPAPDDGRWLCKACQEGSHDGQYGTGRRREMGQVRSERPRQWR